MPQSKIADKAGWLDDHYKEIERYNTVNIKQGVTEDDTKHQHDTFNGLQSTDNMHGCGKASLDFTSLTVWYVTKMDELLQYRLVETNDNWIFKNYEEVIKN